VALFGFIAMVADFFAWLGGRLSRDMDNDEWERGSRSPLERFTNRSRPF
jgi:hypothetical protein